MTLQVIPQGWAVIKEEETVKRVLMAKHAVQINRFINHRGKLWYQDEQWSGFEEVDLVDKEGQPTPGHSTTAALRVHQHGIKYARSEDGTVISHVANEYFSFWQPLPGFETHDICGYCGESNGEQGELRNGFACGFCGGN